MHFIFDTFYLSYIKKKQVHKTISSNKKEFSSKYIFPSTQASIENLSNK